MDSQLLSRLEQMVERLIEKNRVLSASCRSLEAEKAEWLQERRLLLGEVERILTRFDQLDLEES